MITYYDIEASMNYLVEHWGKAGMEVIEKCFVENPFNNSFDKFLDYCTTCGGNWGGLILTGIRKLYPKVYDAIPNNMGSTPFECICHVLVLLGVDTSAE